jgi:hypothetical protein
MRRAISTGGRLRRALRATAALVALLCAAACDGGEGTAPTEPPGLLVVARTPELARLLQRLATLEGTPLARTAAELAWSLPSCAVVEARSPDGSLAGLVEGLACAPERSALTTLHAELGGAAAVFVTPERDGARVRGRLLLDARDQAELELQIPTELAGGAAALLLPGNASPGPGVLSDADTLLHARIRPVGGLDLAALVPEGGQGDRMFRLKSRLFAGAVLDGTWEAAVYLPGEGARMPLAALALGVRAQEPAARAAEEFVAQLEETWSIRRAPFEAAGARGACLPELRILPDFAPCYVTTAQALVVGWNPASVGKALERAGTALGANGGVLVQLSRFPEADLRMARAAGLAPEDLAPGPWERLRGFGRAERDGIRLRLHLQSGDGA